MKNSRKDIEGEYPIIDENFEYRGYHKFGRILGRGSFGTVIECVRKQDSRPIALKLVKSNAIHVWVPKSIVQIKNEGKTEVEVTEDCKIPIEVACLLLASTVNGVVKLNEYWASIDNKQCAKMNKLQIQDTSEEIKQSKEIKQTESVIGMVLERNYNEECLFDYLIEKNFISESDARLIIKQLVEINITLLQIGILHGDLKSENILFDRRTKSIKLIDFGSAELFDVSSSKPVKTFRGTDLYKAPEYLLCHCFYPRPSTVWTIGIILYNLVTGDFPFQTEKEILAHKEKDILFNKETNLSVDLIDLIRKCLAFYVAERIVIDKVLVHPFMVPKKDK